MTILLKNAKVFTHSGFIHKDLLIDHRTIIPFSSFESQSIDRVIDFSNHYILPGFVDVHVHLREPGFLYKEDIESGTKAAAAGGYSAVCAMPNLNPVPDCLSNLLVELDAILEKAYVKVYPYGSITKGRKGQGSLSAMEEIAPYVVAYSDDGCGIQDKPDMKIAMLEAKRLNKMIVAHCEDEDELQPGGCIHDGEYARLHHHVGINSASEYKQVQRDIQLAKETGCKYHVCHVSTKESVEAIRKAKQEGIDITCETGPHYLMFTDNDLQEDGKWKMNPPLRSKEDQVALIQGIKDGTIDCIITDHAPHSYEEKNKGLDGSSFGIVGLETCFGAMYKNLVLQNPLDKNSKEGAITLEKLVELMCINPRKIFNLEGPLEVKEGELADLCVVDLEREWVVDPSKFYSRGKSTLFEGMELKGKPVFTMVNGEIVFDEREGGIIHDRCSMQSDR